MGSDVDPEVNCSTAIRRRIVVGTHVVGRRRPARSSRSTKGGSPGSALRNSASWGSTSTTSQSALRMRARVWATNPSSDAIRIGSGSMTTQAPHSQVAWIAVTSSRVVGPSTATCDPVRDAPGLQRRGHRAGVPVELGEADLGVVVTGDEVDPATRAGEASPGRGVLDQRDETQHVGFDLAA